MRESTGQGYMRSVITMEMKIVNQIPQSQLGTGRQMDTDTQKILEKVETMKDGEVLEVSAISKKILVFKVSLKGLFMRRGTNVTVTQRGDRLYITKGY